MIFFNFMYFLDLIQWIVTKVIKKCTNEGHFDFSLWQRQLGPTKAFCDLALGNRTGMQAIKRVDRIIERLQIQPTRVARNV